MSVSVIAATADHLPVLIVLMREFSVGAPVAFDADEATASFATLIEQPALGAVRLAQVDGAWAGHVVLTVRFAMEYGGLEGWIDDLFVREGFRRQGVATALLDELIADCRRRGVRGLCVDVGAANAPAVSLYGRYGLQPHTTDRIVLVRLCD